MTMLAFVLAAVFQLPPQKSDAVIGVAAIHLESGRRLSIRSMERFPMGSVYKVPIAIEVLHRVDRGALKLDRAVTIQPKDFAPGWSPLRDRAKGKPFTMTVENLLRFMVEVSDNTASDALLRMVGPAAVTKRMADLGVTGIRIDRLEKEMGADLGREGGVERYAADPRDTATPDAMLALLVAIAQRRDGLSQQSHDRLVRWMTATETGKRRIRKGVPRAAIVAHKTGTMPGTTNDAGIIDGKLLLVIFTKAAKSPEKIVEDDIAAVASKVYAELAKTAR